MSKNIVSSEDQLFSWLLTHTRELLIILNSEMQIQTISQATVDFYEFPYDKVIGHHYFSLFKEFEIAPPISQLKLKKIGTEQSFCMEQKVILGLQNQEHVIQWSISKLSQDQGSEKVYILLGKEVTSERQTEKLTTEIHNLKQIINCMPGNAYWMDRKCVYLGCNDNVAKMLKLNSSKDIVGKTYDQMAKLGGWNQGQGESFKQDDLEVMRTGEPKLNKEEPPIKGIDGRLAYFLTSRVPLFDENNEVTGVVGISVDITELKEAQAKEQAAVVASIGSQAEAKAEAEMRQALSVLVGGIVHDLSTPLARISLTGSAIKKHFSNLIECYKLAKEADLPIGYIAPYQIEGLERIPHIFETTLNEMNDFITLTLKNINHTISGTSSSDTLTVCSSDWCISNALERYPFIRSQKKLIHWDRNYGFSFLGNPLLLFTIIFNLMKNSLYQIEEKKRGEIFLTCEEAEDFNLIRVKDTAGGASPHIVERIFEGYRTTKAGGTGVGLAFCKLTMKSFSGDIECHSVEGDHIEFILKFPKITLERREDFHLSKVAEKLDKKGVKRYGHDDVWK